MEEPLSLLIQNCRRLKQYEDVYTLLASQLNKMNEKTIFSKNEMQSICKGYSAITGAICEEEKIVNTMIKMLEEDIYSRKAKELHNDKLGSSKGFRKSIFNSLLDTKLVVINDHVIAYVDEIWIEVQILHRNGSSVIDVAPGQPESQQPAIVDESLIIRMPQYLQFPVLNTSLYSLPVGLEVLALWPTSTTYYDAIVETRGTIRDDEITIHFIDGGERFTLPYSSIIPRRKIISVTSNVSI